MTGVPLHTSRTTDRLLKMINTHRASFAIPGSDIRVLIRTCQECNAWWRSRRKLGQLRTKYRHRRRGTRRWT